MTDGSEHLDTSELENARLSLKKLLEDVDLQVLSHESGPMSFELLPAKSQEEEQMREVVNLVGWPNYTEDIPLEKPRHFDSDQAFLQALRPADQSGHHYVNSSFFYTLLQQEPQREFSEIKARKGSVFSIYGMHPVVLRANAAFPELFGSLRTALIDINFVQEMSVSDGDGVYEALCDEKNKPVLGGMRMAYHLMSRLMKQSDIATFHNMLTVDRTNVRTSYIPSPRINPEALLLKGDDGMIG